MRRTTACEESEDDVDNATVDETVRDETAQGTSGQRAAGEQVVARIETEVAMLLRLADRNRRTGDLLEHALDRSAYLLLRQLTERGPTNVNALAGMLRLDPSTVTRQLLAMASDGLVLRARDPQDGRGTLVTATERGTAALSTTRTARAQVYANVLADWSDADRTSLADLLARLNLDLDRRSRA